MTDRRPNLPHAARRRNRGFEPASRLVAAHIKGPATKRGFAEMKLLSRWPEIAGAEIAAMAQPVTLKYGGSGGLGGTLVLLTTGAQAPLLQMREDEIMTRVNACYGYRAVSRIHITQTASTGFAEGQAAFAAAPRRKANKTPDPAAMADADGQINTVGDDRLRDALGRLAKQVLSRNETYGNKE